MVSTVYSVIILHVQIQKMQWIELGISSVPQGIYILQINLHRSNRDDVSMHVVMNAQLLFTCNYNSMMYQMI